MGKLRHRPVSLVVAGPLPNVWPGAAWVSPVLGPGGGGVPAPHSHPIFVPSPGYLQACRALMITALALGFLAVLSSAVGMKCTRVADGNPAAKGKMATAAGCLFILAGTRSARRCTWAGAGPCWPSWGAAASWGPVAPSPRGTRAPAITTPGPRPARSARGEPRIPAASANTARTPTCRRGDGGDPLHPPIAPDSARQANKKPPQCSC
uniref:Uncharacterized protein n=1 Tax=Chelydra serpentina TaxID=8475 RepID=A0A8C3S8K4_CHESE